MIKMLEETRILILDIIAILKKESDENNRLTQQQIKEALAEQYSTVADRKTIKANMERLIAYRAPQNDFEINYKEATRKGGKDGQATTVYTDFYMMPYFTTEQMRLLIDSILFSKHILPSEKQELIEKLEGLMSTHFKSRMKDIKSVSNQVTTTTNLFENIAQLDEAINKNVQVAFAYNKYVVDDKCKLQLATQVNRDGEERVYVINPYNIVAANGRYYLVCNNDKYDNVSHYRLDRMTNIQLLTTKRKPTHKVNGLEASLDVPQHITEHIYMFAGQSTSVSMRFNKHFLNEFTDWFGTENIMFSNQTADEITARVMVNEMAMRKWALQYALHVKVLTPKSLVEDIKHDINQVWKNYFE